MRFFYVYSPIFVVLAMAVYERFKGYESGGHMNESSGRNRQIPNEYNFSVLIADTT